MTSNHEQVMDALAVANEIRLARAKVKGKIRRGEQSLADALAEDCVQTMSLFGLLRAQPRWGDRRAAVFCEALGVSEVKPIGGLTDRQRVEIGRLLALPAAARYAA